MRFGDATRCDRVKVSTSPSVEESTYWLPYYVRGSLGDKTRKQRFERWTRLRLIEQSLLAHSARKVTAKSVSIDQEERR